MQGIGNTQVPECWPIQAFVLVLPSFQVYDRFLQRKLRGPPQGVMEIMHSGARHQVSTHSMAGDVVPAFTYPP